MIYLKRSRKVECIFVIDILFTNLYIEQNETNFRDEEILYEVDFK